MTQWQAIIHHHLKRDKVIPSSHPQHNEIHHNPNGYKALMPLVAPYHPAFTDNGILIQPHPRQGKRSLDEHFRWCDYYYFIQKCYLNTEHNWGKDIHIICFLDSCEGAAVLRTLYNQEKHVPECHYKFTRESIAATIKECIDSQSFTLMGGRTSTAVVSAATGAGAVTRSRPTSGATRYRFLARALVVPELVLVMVPSGLVTQDGHLAIVRFVRLLRRRHLRCWMMTCL